MHQTKSYLVEAASPAAGAGTGVWGWTKTRQHLAVPYSNGGRVVSCSWPIKVLLAKVSCIIHFQVEIGQWYPPKPLFHLSGTFSPDTAQAHGWLVATVQFPRLSKSSPDLAAAHPYWKGLWWRVKGGHIWRVKMIRHPKSWFRTASLSFWSNEITTCSLLDF